MTSLDASEALGTFGSTESTWGQVRHFSWLICEPRRGELGHRFVTAVYRFAPAMMPAGGVPRVDLATIATCRDQMDLLMRSGIPSVLLWSIQREDVLAILDQVMALANHPTQLLSRCVLPIVACDCLSRGGELALAETGVSVFLRHPEDLPKFAPVVQAHFASFAGGVK